MTSLKSLFYTLLIALGLYTTSTQSMQPGSLALNRENQLMLYKIPSLSDSNASIHVDTLFALDTLIQAIIAGCPKLIDSIIRDYGVNLNFLRACTRAPEGLTSRIYISSLNHMAEDQKIYQLSPLMIAVYEQRQDIVMQLLDHGADTEFTDGSPMTALVIAIGTMNPAIIKLLIQRGAKITEWSLQQAQACEKYYHEKYAEHATDLVQRSYEIRRLLSRCYQ